MSSYSGQGQGQQQQQQQQQQPMFQMSNQNIGTNSSNNSLTGGMSGMGAGGDFANLDLEELFVDCYYDVPGLNFMANNQAANGGPGVPSPTTSTAAAAAAAGGSASMATATAAGTKRGAQEMADPNNSNNNGGGGGGDDDDDDDDDDFGDARGTAASSATPTGALTLKQKLERRERNREHAKRSRLRKKFLLESLQEQIAGLQEQMEKLKGALRTEVVAPGRADQLIESICGNANQYTPLPMPSGFGPVKTLMEPDFRLMSALSGSQQNFAISDPTLPDNPIVYVSQGFLDLTGYELDQVLGRNCRFLQGPGTDQNAVDVIRKGVTEGIDTSVCLLNYKADGTPFWNQFFVAALRDAENNVVNYVGVQCEVSKAVVEKHMGSAEIKGK